MKAKIALIVLSLSSCFLFGLLTGLAFKGEGYARELQPGLKEVVAVYQSERKVFLLLEDGKGPRLEYLPKEFNARVETLQAGDCILITKNARGKIDSISLRGRTAKKVER